MSKIITVSVEISEEQASALAQFAARVSWSELRQNAHSDDVADLMKSGIDAVHKALKLAGYNPR